MPNDLDPADVSLPERLQRIAAIFALGVTRWRQAARSDGVIHGSESAESGLEVSGETRLSVSGRTRGFTPADDGDNG